MPKLLNQKSAAKLLQENGWTESVGGKHNVKMVKPGHRPITLPKHKAQDYSFRVDEGDTETGWDQPEGSMSKSSVEYIVRVHQEEDAGPMWAEVLDLPGCFASGDSLDELREAVEEAISLYVAADDPDAGAIRAMEPKEPQKRMQVEEMRVQIPA